MEALILCEFVKLYPVLDKTYMWTAIVSLFFLMCVSTQKDSYAQITILPGNQTSQFTNQPGVDTNFVKVDRKFDGVDGWDPDGSRSRFDVVTAVGKGEGAVIVSLNNSRPTTCSVFNEAIDLIDGKGVSIQCTTPPSNGAMLYLAKIDYGGLL